MINIGDRCVIVGAPQNRYSKLPNLGGEFCTVTSKHPSIPGALLVDVDSFDARVYGNYCKEIGILPSQLRKIDDDDHVPSEIRKMFDFEKVDERSPYKEMK